MGNIPKKSLQSVLPHILLGFAFRYANLFYKNLMGFIIFFPEWFLSIFPVSCYLTITINFSFLNGNYSLEGFFSKI